MLSHGEGETGNRFLLLEGTDGRVYHIGYTQELDEARARGDLRTNSFVVIDKRFDEDRKRRIEVLNFGDAEGLLADKEHFHSLAKRLIRRGLVSLEDERWNGWLGRYQNRLSKELSEAVEVAPRPREQGKGHER